MSPTKTKKNVFRNLNTFESKRVVGGVMAEQLMTLN